MMILRDIYFLLPLPTFVSLLVSIDRRCIRSYDGSLLSNYLDVHEIKADDFFLWDDYLDLLYKKAIKAISKYHYFHYTEGKLIKKITVESQSEDTETLSKLKKRSTDEERKAWATILKQQFPDIDNAPGLAEIKQVELFTKWKPFVPEEFKDIICPEPPKAVLDKVKLDKRNKAKSKAEA